MEGKSRFTAVRETDFIPVLFINYYITIYMNSYKQTFALHCI